MKHLGSRSDFTDCKREELLQAYLNSTGEVHFAQTGSSRFWVSENRAAIVMGRMEKGDELDDMTPEKRRMYHELYRRMKRLKEKQPQITLLDAMCELVNSAAPSFYMARSTAERTVRNMIAQRRRKRLGLQAKSSHPNRRKEYMLKKAATNLED